MMSDMPPRDMDLREWADTLDVPLWTVRGWVKMADFPEPSRLIGSSRVYLKRDLDSFLARHPTLGRGRGGWNRKAGE